jgi:dGTP triphosphohydrolase
MYGELRRFLTVNFYRTSKVRVRAMAGVDAIRRVFAALVSEPSRLPPAWRGELDCRDRRAVVGAYIATMTDRFLLDMDTRLR